MAISDFPSDLQPLIQQKFLEREFIDSLEPKMGYRAIADVEEFPTNVGETITKTRTGLIAPTEEPLDPRQNTNLDNGMTPKNFSIEQYVMSLNMYGDTMDLNVVTQKVGIKNRFLKNAATLGIQARQSLDRISRNALFDSYMGGNTRVRVALGSPAATISVDDVRGFENVVVNGQVVAVGNNSTMPVVVGSNVYTLIGATRDITNVSTAFRGISGTLTFSTNVSTSDAALGNAVIGAYAPVVLRPNLRATTGNLTTSDLMTMSLILDAVTVLRNNAVPEIDGLYNCYLDDTSARQLFADPEFQLLYRGQYDSDDYKNARVIELLDVRYIRTNEAPQQTITNASSATVKVHRPIICGQGALIEGRFDGLTDTLQKMGDNSESELVVEEGVAMVTRPPLDRAKQIIAQTWYAINGYAVPTDVTATKEIIPTANDSYFKRAVMLEVGSA